MHNIYLADTAMVSGSHKQSLIECPVSLGGTGGASPGMSYSGRSYSLSGDFLFSSHDPLINIHAQTISCHSCILYYLEYYGYDLT